MKRLGALLAAVGLLVTGCGGGGEADRAPTSSVKSHPAAVRTVFDESEIVGHLHLKNDTYISPDGQRCDVAAVLTSANQVTTYADAGDPVATNPAGTAGVKVVSPQTATCVRLLTAALADLSQP